MKLAQALALPASPEGSSGLTVRQHFAGLAMQGMVADGNYVDIASTGIARDAVQMADALIAELEKSA